MSTNMNKWNPLMKARKTIAVLALAFAVALGGYEFVKPASASAANIVPAPAAAALDDNSVSALTALDHAMETLAAHVTPAVVNVTVVSRNRGESAHVRGQSQQDQGQGDDQNDQNQGQDRSSVSLDRLVSDNRCRKCAADRRLNTDWAAALSYRPTATLSPTIT